MEQQPDPALRRWYALELLLVGDFDKAQTQYHKAWEEGDTHQETIINLARLYARKNHFTKAAGLWDEASRRQLIKGELRWEAALTYSYAQRYQDALEIIAPLRAQNSKDPKLLLFSGQLHFYQKHWGQAAHFFSTYLEQNPRDVEVRRQLAEVLSFEPANREQALSQYDEVLKIQDDVNLRLRRIKSSPGGPALGAGGSGIAKMPDSGRPPPPPGAGPSLSVAGQPAGSPEKL